jgi:hypothetical protein
MLALFSLIEEDREMRVFLVPQCLPLLEETRESVLIRKGQMLSKEG